MLEDQGREPALVFARALVYRLDGESFRAAEGAAWTWNRLGPETEPEIKAFVAQVAAEAHRDLDDGEEALVWYRWAVESGGVHQGAVAAQGAEAARALGEDDLAEALLRTACSAGHPLACQRLRRRPAARGPGR